MTKILSETTKTFPFEWANLNSYRESNAFRNEIYLKEQVDITEHLIILFHTLFGGEDGFIIYNRSWWDYCLDTWDFDNDDYDYSLNGKSGETQAYLRMLIESGIPINYKGCCTCSDWDRFLFTTLRCVISHQAPYSPLFCSEENGYFFYFHHTGSIGIYYEKKNESINQILLKASEFYIVESG